MPLLAGVMAIFTIAGSSFGQSIDSLDALKHKALVNAPRTREAFPLVSFRSAGAGMSDSGKRGAEDRLKNLAWARSPRALEEFPTLSRPGSHLAAKSAIGIAGALKNRAWAASPRGREEFPWFDRIGLTAETSDRVEIAPLK